jgi:hypothetical protein
MAGKFRQSLRGIDRIHRKGFKKIDRVRRGKSLLGELGVSGGGKRKAPQDVIGYDGKDFTRNGEKTTRDSLRMG